MALKSGALTSVTANEPQMPVWIAHMWQRLHRHKRLGLILGAGVSVDAGCPKWKELINRLADEHTASRALMTAHRSAGLQEAYLAQILFEKHSSREGKRHRKVKPAFMKFQVGSSWMESIHRCLYKDLAGKTFEKILLTHPYLGDLGELAYHAAFTVNFNFDDLVDEAIFRYAGRIRSVNPEIIFRPKLETRRNAPVVYHINGFLPWDKRRRRSEQVVLTEDAFAEIMQSPSSLDAEFVTAQFTTTTFLIIGSSLTDGSLKNMLRAGGERNPANHHYIVYWENPIKRRSAEQKRDIFDVNLRVYNLISMFLTTPELACLIKILNIRKRGNFAAEISKISKEKICRKYYLVGPIAGGKSSNLEMLRCFSTHEEWRGRPPAVMYQDDKTLTAAQQGEVDDFLFPQLMEKNQRMIRAEPGIHIMDRAYLDLFAFSKNRAENLRKANELKRRIIDPGDALEDGQIIFLEANRDTLEERLARRGKRKGRLGHLVYNAHRLVAQARTLKRIYRPRADSVLDTSQDSLGQTARRIARMILLKKYYPFKFDKVLDRIRVNGGKV